MADGCTCISSAAVASTDSVHQHGITHTCVAPRIVLAGQLQGAAIMRFAAMTSMMMSTTTAMADTAPATHHMATKMVATVVAEW